MKAQGTPSPTLLPRRRRSLGSGDREPPAGGLAGANAGARIQARLPHSLIRRLAGVLVVAIGARCLWSGLG
jgi:hypothetical protein